MATQPFMPRTNDEIASMIGDLEEQLIRIDGRLGDILPRIQAKLTRLSTSVSKLATKSNVAKEPPKRLIVQIADQRIGDIAKIAQLYFGLSCDVSVRYNRPEYVHARHLVMYMARSLGYSLQEIAHAFGKHHTTVLHGLTKMERMLAISSVTRRQLEELRGQCGFAEKKRPNGN